MDLLFVTLNFHPDRLGNAPIVTDLARGLARRGHRVRVVCALPHHETGSIAPGYGGRLWQHDVVDGVQVLRLWIATGNGFAMKLANYASFTAAAALAAALLPTPDVIFSPSPPITLGLVDALVARFKGVPFVFNLQDVFPDVAVRMGVLRNPPLIRTFRWMEALTYRHAARLAVITPSMVPLLIEKGVERERIELIPNCVDVDAIQPQTTSELRAALGLQDHFVVGFSGRIGYSQGLETVVEAARLLSEDPRVVFLIVGSGAAQPHIQSLASELGLRNMRFLPTQPRERLSDTLAASDLHLVPLRQGLAQYSLPSKLLGVMAAGRPVVASLEAESDAGQLVADSGCGTVVAPQEPHELAEAVRAYTRAPQRCADEGAAGRRHIVEHLHPSTMIEHYERLFDEVRRTSRPGRTRRS